MLLSFRRHRGDDGHQAGPRSFSVIARFAIVAGVLTLTCSGFLLFHYPPSSSLRTITEHFTGSSQPPSSASDQQDVLRQVISDYLKARDTLAPADLHPIDYLIEEALEKQDKVLQRETKDIASAADRYREVRGRHPPPGFDLWMQYAINSQAIVVEEFFDRIYDDLRPFWALPANVTAARARAWYHVVRVRKGKAEGFGDVEGRVPWLQLWTKLVQEAAPSLPDVDMPINYMDESRLLVPWGTINDYVAQERKRRTITPVDGVTREFTGLAAIDAAQAFKANSNETAASDEFAYDPEWVKTNSPQYWNLARITCAPDSPSRNVEALTDFQGPASLPENWQPSFSQSGYVKNFTASADPCTQPHLRGMHGTFAEPVSISSAAELIPLFSGSKLTMNNEILIPGAMYLTDDPFYSGGEDHGPAWSRKDNKIVWRGVASGGRHRAENWAHFQRHRLLEMLNSTTVAAAENATEGHRGAMSFAMASPILYNYGRRRNHTVHEMIAAASDTGFTDLLCFPQDECDYMTEHFSKVEGVPMKKQYVHKYIPDADGNSFSARFRGLLRSTSLPIKATIYAEWHDTRLMPWVHFAPLDNTFQELHAMLAYFLEAPQGDAAARLLAVHGQFWAEKVLRRDDMLLYVWRLLLEFARVCDDHRDTLGYVDDLLAPPPQAFAQATAKGTP